MSIHLIHVGYPKTASTWLQAWFDAHPDILYAPHHLGGSQGPFGLARQAAGGDVDKARVTSCEDLSMPTRGPAEWHLTETAQEAVARTLHSLFPNAHILFVTRGWREVIPSAHSEMVRMGLGQPFDDFVATAEIRSAMPVVMNYDRLIGLYRALFGSDRVKALPQELLRDDRRAFLEVIEGMLHVPPGPEPEGRRNKGLSPAELTAFPLISRTIQRLPSSRLRNLGLLAHLRLMKSRVGPRIARAIVAFAPRPPADPDYTLPQETLDAIHAGSRKLVEEPFYRPYAHLYTR